MPIKDLPPDARPRETLMARSAAALRDVELSTLLLRTCIKDKGVLPMADVLHRLRHILRILITLNGLPGVVETH